MKVDHALDQQQVDMYFVRKGTMLLQIYHLKVVFVILTFNDALRKYRIVRRNSGS